MEKATFVITHHPNEAGAWQETVKAHSYDAVANKLFGRDKWSRILPNNGQGQIFCPTSGYLKYIQVQMVFNGDVDTVEFNGKTYPLVYVELADGTNVPVSSSALQDALLDAEGSYLSEEAREVDERIACFMPHLQNATREQVLAFAEECYA